MLATLAALGAPDCYQGCQSPLVGFALLAVFLVVFIIGPAVIVYRMDRD